MPSMRTPPSIQRAVTWSPGRSIAKPRTSKPHATLDTVAGAKAVALFMVGNILPVAVAEHEARGPTPVRPASDAVRAHHARSSNASTAHSNDQRGHRQRVGPHV
jgi:hypothetical protein